jgi:hypothetical protein
MEEKPKAVYNGRTPKEALSTDEGLQVAVGEKGAVSVYGIGRFPVTLYAPTWQRLFAGCEDTTGPAAEILQFIAENQQHLAPPPDASRGAKPKTETFSLSADKTIAIGVIADRMAGSELVGDRKFAAKLMSIKATAEMSGGKVTYEQLVFATEAVANAAKPAPNAANAGRTDG